MAETRMTPGETSIAVALARAVPAERVHLAHRCVGIEQNHDRVQVRFEHGVDRYGGDLRHFDMPAGATVKACQQACETEAACRAWTYVRPGYIGQASVCYLKDRITRPVRKPCCLAGVVR